MHDGDYSGCDARAAKISKVIRCLGAALSGAPSPVHLACRAAQAPELLLSPTSYDGKAADVWACGVLLYTLLTGAVRPPKAVQVLFANRLLPRQGCPGNWS